MQRISGKNRLKLGMVRKKIFVKTLTGCVLAHRGGLFHRKALLLRVTVQARKSS